MKSVIAQGSTVVKAVEEALKKAGQPAEFFVKLLEDAQGGFLGFGSKKAKIALFFKQNPANYKLDNVLNQESYQGLFDNNAISKQIEQQLKDVNQPKSTSTQKPQHQSQPRPTNQRPQQKLNSIQTPKQSPPKQHDAPQQKQPQKNQHPQQKHFEQKQQQQLSQNHPVRNQTKNTSTKLNIRPLPVKNNDSSKE